MKNPTEFQNVSIEKDRVVIDPFGTLHSFVTVYRPVPNANAIGVEFPPNAPGGFQEEAARKIMKAVEAGLDLIKNPSGPES